MGKKSLKRKDGQLKERLKTLQQRIEKRLEEGQSPTLTKHQVAPSDNMGTESVFDLREMNRRIATGERPLSVARGNDSQRQESYVPVPWEQQKKDIEAERKRRKQVIDDAKSLNAKTEKYIDEETARQSAQQNQYKEFERAVIRHGHDFENDPNISDKKKEKIKKFIDERKTEMNTPEYNGNGEEWELDIRKGGKSRKNKKKSNKRKSKARKSRKQRK